MQDSGSLPNRKLPRLTQYDYSQNGYYFVTICANHHQELFSHISFNSASAVQNQLTNYGKAVEFELLQLPHRFPGVVIDKYVIMPNHIHAIIAFQNNADYSLSDVICAYKSLAVRKCKQLCPIDTVFQKSFHDHIIRGYSDYENIWSYIDANPMNWDKDCFYPESAR